MKTKKWEEMSRKEKIVGFLIVFTIFSMIVSALSGDKSEAPNQSSQTESKTESKDPKELYERVKYEEGETVENIAYVYYGQDKTEIYLEKLVREIKAKECKKPCNITLFDDPKAAELDWKLKDIKNEAEEKEWKRRNYIFVADHFPAYLEFEGEGIFFYYPYKDWAYDELKSAQ